MLCKPFAVDRYDLSTQSVHNTLNKMVDRPRLAVTKWLPYSAVGAAISFVVGFVFSLPPPQVIIAAAMTATMILTGLVMQSYGREKEQARVQN